MLHVANTENTTLQVRPLAFARMGGAHLYVNHSTAPRPPCSEALNREAVGPLVDKAEVRLVGQDLGLGEAVEQPDVALHATQSDPMLVPLVDDGTNHIVFRDRVEKTVEESLKLFEDT